MAPQLQPATLAGDLRELLAELSDHLETADCYLGDIRDAIDSPRASRLAYRRQSSVVTDVAPVLELFGWFLSEGLEQVDELTSALGTLLEAPHTGRNYGRRHGVYVQTPTDWTCCGTPAGYHGHWRRGQDACRACKKAHSRYNSEHRSSRKPLVFNAIQLGEARCR
jgi:hypothetical protein